MEAEEWLARIAGLVPASSTGISIATKTPLQHVQEITKTLDSSVIGSPQTVSFRSFTDHVISIVSKYAGTMPSDPTVAIVFHALRGKSCRPPFPDSSWRYREPHYVTEILGYGLTTESYETSRKWAEDFGHELSKADSSLEGTYFSLTSSINFSLEKVFGEHLQELRRLKDEHDPDRVFKHAITGL